MERNKNMIFDSDQNFPRFIKKKRFSLNTFFPKSGENSLEFKSPTV